MKLPSGAGLWPTFWLLGDNIDKVRSPTCGEIDVMEEWGDAPTSVRGSLHGPLPGGGSYDLNKSFQLGPDLSPDFHEYAIEWAPNSVKFFVDDIEYANFGPGDVYGGGRWGFNRRRRKRRLGQRDPKSTRLNSSHTVISYAVFCLEKTKRAWTLAR